MAHHPYFISILMMFITCQVAAQAPVDTTRYKTTAADPMFLQQPKSWQKKWGMNRRAEWAVPVRVPIFRLDTAFGGLIPYERGGGNESRTLHLRNPAKKEYTLRSVTKSRNDVVPADFKGTFVEKIIYDGISSSHPYASFALPGMQQAAGLLYTMPRLVYVPSQTALDSFNQRFADGLYLIEQRPAGNWQEASNLGNHDDFTSTDKLIKKLQEDSRYRPDAFHFAKARLFDVLIGDWDRHEGNWRWGKKEEPGKRIYTPVARDRDQAFYTHNGSLLDKLLPAAGFSYMQHFDYKIGNPVTLNKAAWDMDRYFAQSLTREDWIRAGKDLQEALTDEVISSSVAQLPPEIFAVSGQELIGKLKSRREQLPAIAETYYRFLAREVEVTGSLRRERFYIRTASDSTVQVIVFSSGKDGISTVQPVYQRTFVAAETNEIRIFGIGGEDSYHADLKGSPIPVRIIGGPQKDSILHTGGRLHIYDNRDNYFQTASPKWHLSSDSSVHRHDYKNPAPDSKGFGPAIGYNQADRIYFGVKYSFTTHRWRRLPFATDQTIRVQYAIQQHAISAGYEAYYPNLFGNWGLFIDANYDAVRWTNYFGLGNETTSPTKRNGYHRTLSQEMLGNAGLRYEKGKHLFEAAGFFQQTKIKRDTGSYVSKYYNAAYETQLRPNNYAGAWLMYQFMSLNDNVVPTRGFATLARAVISDNLSQRVFFQHYTLRMQSYIPMGNKFSLAIGAGGSTVMGAAALLNSARVYEHAVIGGTRSMRGYRIERFWGKTAFYNQNELRFITNIRTYLLNAKAGLLAFFDDGRVWVPGQKSDQLHTSYGGGVIVAPFNRLCVTVTYGISPETKMVQLKVNRIF